MRSARIEIDGHAFVADLSGALYWPSRKTLVVADLHFEKGSRFARGGQFLPPYDTRRTLERLSEVLAVYPVDKVVCLGDSVDDEGGVDRAASADAEAIAALSARYDWVWIRGNHDPTPPSAWGGRVADTLLEDGVALRHEADQGTATAEMSGHFHPKASLRVRARRVSAPCFVHDGRRLILPAFGTFTGGLSVLSPAIASLFPEGFSTVILGRRTVHVCGADRLVP